MGNIIGATLSLPFDQDTRGLIEKSRADANKYEWLYHCTSVDALISIIKNREMWLSNLKTVNDKEEVKRIDDEEYEDSYYVACFTYDANITENHWREYGQSEKGIIVGMKKE